LASIPVKEKDRWRYIFSVGPGVMADFSKSSGGSLNGKEFSYGQRKWQVRSPYYW